MKPSRTTANEAARTMEAIEAFNEAFGTRDVDAVMGAMTTDCLFENTSPPDGKTYQGADEVRAAWTEFFMASPDAVFETEQICCHGDRAVATWVYRWGGTDGGHIRGVDLFRVRDDKIAEKRSYVKG